MAWWFLTTMSMSLALVGLLLLVETKCRHESLVPWALRSKAPVAGSFTG
jgi:hypothetical protein